MAKVKVPKKVAGVKIPKKVRKRAKQALKLAENPVVRDAAVAALGAAGVTKAATELGDGKGKGRRIDADTLVEAIREAALEGVRRFIEGFEEGLRKATAAAGEAAEAVEQSAGGDEDERPRRRGKGDGNGETRRDRA